MSGERGRRRLATFAETAMHIGRAAVSGAPLVEGAVSVDRAASGGRVLSVGVAVLLAGAALFGSVGCSRCASNDPAARDPVPLAPRAEEPALGKEAPEEPQPSEGRRRCDGSAPGSLRLTPVAQGLSLPLYVLSEPGSAQRLYVLEKGGRVKRVVDKGAPETILTLSVKTAVEMGLLGMAFHPRFGDEERRVYLSYVDADGWSRLSVFRMGEERIDPDSEQVLLHVEQPAPNHNGGMVAFGPDGLLYLGLGDGGGRDDQYGNGQNLATPLGTILRFDPERPDVPPAGNRSGEGEDRRIFHYGLRNPWRFSFDAVTGDLFIGDVGQNHWEEIDALPRGAPGTNFGWPTFEGTHRCPGCDTNVPEPSPDMVPPIHEYPRGSAASVTGGYVYRGKKIPSLYGRYVYADFVHGWVRALTWDGQRACDHYDLTESLDPDGRLLSVASLGEDSERELYVVSFSGGEVFRIDPGQ